jgi:hypothetical protein
MMVNILTIFILFKLDKTQNLYNLKKKIYGYPDIGNFGLGHSLLAWARCYIWCHNMGAIMLGPRWLRLRIGPYLRRERDKRNYALLFNNYGYVNGMARYWILARHRKVSAELPRSGNPLDMPTPGAVVVFRNALAKNEQKHFHEVYGHAALLHRELRRITRSAYLPSQPERPFIAVHVRMGDFVQPSSVDGIQANVLNVRLPLGWYVQMLTAVRKNLGFEVPAIIFSDGDDQALAPLLALPETQRPPLSPSITDMLSIAQAGLLISSGSGFSLWGAFLGDVPRICYPGQSVVAAHLDPAMEVECANASELPFEFVARIRRSFTTC